MRRNRLACVVIAGSLALSGCAISGGEDIVPTVPVNASAVQASQLPVLSTQPPQVIDQASVPEKFAQSDDQMLTVAADPAADADAMSAAQQAYADPFAEQSVISTKKSELKPFVGRWVLSTSKAKARIQKISSYLGIGDQCEIVLEEGVSDNGRKAKGSSACPTSLFMLESWTAYDRLLVLKDHMGDEIVKMRSNGSDMWVGVNKAGETLILNKS